MKADAGPEVVNSRGSPSVCALRCDLCFSKHLIRAEYHLSFLLWKTKSYLDAMSDKDTGEPSTARSDAAEKGESSSHAIGLRPEVFSSTFTEVLFVATCTMAVGMQTLLTGSNTVITVAIAKDLRMTNAETSWIVASSSLTCGSFLLFFGRVADLFGRKRPFVGSLFLFAVFALAAGFSKTPLSIDVLNGVLGLLAASAVPAAIGSLGSIYDTGSRRRNYAFAAYSAGNPVGFVCGFLFGGLATRIFDWRASYFLLAIIYLVTTVAAFFAMPADKVAASPLNLQALKRFDAVGALLTIAGIGMFGCALRYGPAQLCSIIS